ncbi:ribosomal protein L23-domain-containing protein [Pilaira anomala]|nr:ribosomal protein L23-domain-containing protein [Pilaira anomala]
MIRAPNLQPNQVAFKVPPSCNKFDIHSYITNIYGVEVQEVRTMNYATEHKKARGGSMEVKTPSYKKAIITLNETFEWPKGPEWCELEQEQGKLGSKAAGRKMKGWRFRGTEEERNKLKIVNDKIQAKMEAEHSKK